MSPSTRLSLLLYFILLIAFLTSSQMITSSSSSSFKVDAAADEGGLVNGRIRNITLITDDHAIMRISPDNLEFDIDLAAVGINPVGDGLVCLINDPEGTLLCEPFKVENQAISEQITEINS